MSAPGSDEYECDVVCGGLELLLAAVHADDPKREILVRIGDLMRDMEKVRARIGCVVSSQKEPS